MHTALLRGKTKSQSQQNSLVNAMLAKARKKLSFRDLPDLSEGSSYCSNSEGKKEQEHGHGTNRRQSTKPVNTGTGQQLSKSSSGSKLCRSNSSGAGDNQIKQQRKPSGSVNKAAETKAANEYSARKSPSNTNLKNSGNQNSKYAENQNAKQDNRAQYEEDDEEIENDLEKQALRIVRTIGQAFEINHSINQQGNDSTKTSVQTESREDDLDQEPSNENQQHTTKTMGKDLPRSIGLTKKKILNGSLSTCNSNTSSNSGSHSKSTLLLQEQQVQKASDLQEHRDSAELDNPDDDIDNPNYKTSSKSKSNYMTSGRPSSQTNEQHWATPHLNSRDDYNSHDNNTRPNQQLRNDEAYTSNEMQYLRDKLEQQSLVTQAALSQVQHLRENLAAETGARIEAQARLSQLLTHNKELLDHLQTLVRHIQDLEGHSSSTTLSARNSQHQPPPRSPSNLPCDLHASQSQQQMQQLQQMQHDNQYSTSTNYNNELDSLRRQNAALLLDRFYYDNKYYSPSPRLPYQQQMSSSSLQIQPISPSMRTSFNFPTPPPLILRNDSNTSEHVNPEQNTTNNYTSTGQDVNNQFIKPLGNWETATQGTSPNTRRSGLANIERDGASPGITSMLPVPIQQRGQLPQKSPTLNSSTEGNYASQSDATRNNRTSNVSLSRSVSEKVGRSSNSSELGGDLTSALRSGWARHTTK